MSQRLENRVAVVTGGSGYLGRAVVRRLLAAGARVHVTWRDEDEVQSLRDYLGREAGRIGLHEVDLTREPEVQGALEEVLAADGRLDILCNIAGGFAGGPIEDTDAAGWEKLLAMNATTAYLACRAAARAMSARHYGRILNVGAAPALGRGAAGMSAYSAAKAAVLNLTWSLAKELAPHGITVNAIVPSTIDTPANRKAMPDADTATWLDPDEIAEVVGFLVSDAAGIVTGSAVNLERARRQGAS